jgi:hypothetical protein
LSLIFFLPGWNLWAGAAVQAEELAGVAVLAGELAEAAVLAGAGTAVMVGAAGVHAGVVVVHS